MRALAFLLLLAAAPARAENLFPEEVKEYSVQRNMDFLYEQFSAFRSSVSANMGGAAAAFVPASTRTFEIPNAPGLTNTSFACLSGSTVTLSTATGLNLSIKAFGIWQTDTGGASVWFNILEDGQFISRNGAGFSASTAPYQQTASDANYPQTMHINFEVSGPAVGTHTYCLASRTNSGTYAWRPDPNTQRGGLFISEMGGPRGATGADGAAGATVTVNASMYGNGATTNPLGVDSSSVAVLNASGYVPNALHDPSSVTKQGFVTLANLSGTVPQAQVNLSTVTTKFDAVGASTLAITNILNTVGIATAALSVSTENFRVWQGTISPVIQASKVWQGTASPQIELTRVWQGTVSPVIELSRVWQGTGSPILDGLSVWKGTVSPVIGAVATTYLRVNGTNEMTGQLTVNNAAGVTASSYTATYGVRAATGTFSSGVTASSGTFLNTGAAAYSIQTSSGINMATGLFIIGAGGYVQWPDGTFSTTSAGGGSGSGGPGLTSTQTWSGTNIWTSTTVFGGNSLAQELSMPDIYARNMSGAATSSGCVVNVTMGSVAGLTNTTSNRAVFTSTTTSGTAGMIGVTKEACSPGNDCRIALSGIVRHLARPACATGNVGKTISTWTTRCEANCPGLTPTSGQTGATLSDDWGSNWADTWIR